MCSPAECREKTFDCLSIEQKNVYYGTLKLFIAKEVVRVEISNSNTTIVCKAPTWRVSAFNKDGKVEMSKSLDQWCEEGGFGFGGDPNKKSNWREALGKTAKRSSSKYMGFNVYELTVPFEWMARIERLHRKVLQRGVLKVFIASDSLNISEPQLRFLRTLYGTPKVGSLPLYKVQESPEVKEIQYETKNVRRIPLPRSAFEYPSKFRQVNSFAQLAIGVLKLQKNNISDIVDGLSRDFDKPMK